MTQKMKLDSQDQQRLRLDRQLCFALYNASNTMTRLYRPHLQKLGLTYPQYLVLLALWSKQPQLVGDLGAELGLNFGTLSPLLKRMAIKGLIQRQRDPQDERRVSIALTSAGQALRQPALAMQTDLGCELNLAADNISQLRESLQLLTLSLSQVEANQPQKTTPPGVTP